MKRKKWFYAFLIALPVVLGAIVGMLTKNGVLYYRLAVIKPTLTPPAIVFPIAWSALYLLMGISSALICSAFSTFPAPQKQRNFVWFIYGLQLFINLLWPILFFNARLYLFSAIWLMLLIGCVFIMIIAFKPIKPATAYLQIPYILWLCFAAYLNFGVYLLNGVK